MPLFKTWFHTYTQGSLSTFATIQVQSSLKLNAICQKISSLCTLIIFLNFFFWKNKFMQRKVHKCHFQLMFKKLDFFLLKLGFISGNILIWSHYIFVTHERGKRGLRQQKDIIMLWDLLSLEKAIKHMSKCICNVT